MSKGAGRGQGKSPRHKAALSHGQHDEISVSGGNDSRETKRAATSRCSILPYRPRPHHTARVYIYIAQHYNPPQSDRHIVSCVWPRAHTEKQHLSKGGQPAGCGASIILGMRPWKNGLVCVDREPGIAPITRLCVGVYHCCKSLLTLLSPQGLCKRGLAANTEPLRNVVDKS